MLKLIPILQLVCAFGLAAPANQPNVLFLVVDDLAVSALSTYSQDGIIYTPNMAEFASRGLQFDNTYAQQAVCGPSRNSFLTSRLPDQTGVHSNHGYFRRNANFTTLPQYFKEHGYQAVSVGKVFHHNDDYPYSWSRKPYHAPTEKNRNDPVCPPDQQSNVLCAVDVKLQPQQTLPDIQSKDFAIDYLKNAEEPFFLAVGFHKPHIPLKFPKEYLDLYPLDQIKEADNPDRSDSLPSIAWNPWTDVRSRHDVAQLNVSFPYGRLPSLFARKMRQHYFAATSYVDDLIGEVLEAVADKAPDNIVVSLIGDHGWSLGQHQEWAKYSNYRTASQTPWMLSAPGKTPGIKGFKRTNVLDSDRSEIAEPWKKVKDPVMLLDLMPTLVELTDLPSVRPCVKHDAKDMTCTDGKSVVSLFEEEEEVAAAAGSRGSIAYFQYPRPSMEPQMDSDQPPEKEIKYMGYGCASQRYKLTEWVEFRDGAAVWNATVGLELYDLMLDPEENRNRVTYKKYRHVVNTLRKVIRKFF